MSSYHDNPRISEADHAIECRLGLGHASDIAGVRNHCKNCVIPEPGEVMCDCAYCRAEYLAGLQKETQG